MKRIVLSLVFLIILANCFSQTNTNTLPLDGDIGIGTLNPSAPLEINKSNAGIRILTDLTHQPYVTLGTNMTDRWSLGVYEITNLE